MEYLRSGVGYVDVREGASYPDRGDVAGPWAADAVCFAEYLGNLLVDLTNELITANQAHIPYDSYPHAPAPSASGSHHSQRYSPSRASK